jgi:pimeloyl-[acyl-carrier protein] methyl ester esterase
VDTLLLLPGLDGTGLLFAPVLPELKHAFELEPVGYPKDRVLDLDALAAYAASRVPAGVSYAIVAESFSGPVALRLAAAAPPGLFAVVLVGSFVSPPIGWVLRAGLRLIADIIARPRLSSPTAYLLTGGDQAMAAQVHVAAATVPPRVLASRLRMLTHVDARRDLALCPVPLLYLAGQSDRLVARSHAREIERLRADVTVRELPAPHLILQAQPKLAAQEIASWLQSLRGARV